MKLVIQRVKFAKVEVDEKTISEIGTGLFSLIGIAKGDTKQTVTKLIEKAVGLRIFEDEAGKMNKSLIDVGGEHLIVSQFTLLADTSSGKRPSFIQAEAPEKANELYEWAIAESARLGVKTHGGKFAADMKITLLNDGPVTIVLEG